MKKLIFAAAAMVLVSACKQPSEGPSQMSGESVLIRVNQESVTDTTVNISAYTLISNDPDRDSIEAVEVLKVKRAFVLALQQKDSVAMNSHLSDAFTYRSATEFFAKNDFINDRSSGKWRLSMTNYGNLALQFWGDVAVLSYHNEVTGEDNALQPFKINLSATDVYKKEDGKWLLSSVHEISTK